MAQTTNRVQPTYVDKDVPVFPVSVAQYHDMIRGGSLTENDPVELIEGVLVLKMPKNRPHKVSKRKLISVMDRLLPPGWFFQVEDPVTLSDSEPEPDGAILRGGVDDYLDRDTTSADMAMVIEISDSTLRYDRREKGRIYSRSNIATYWIINLIDRTIEVYTRPQPNTDEPAYADRQDFGEANAVPVILDGQSIGSVTVHDVLP